MESIYRVERPGTRDRENHEIGSRHLGPQLYNSAVPDIGSGYTGRVKKPADLFENKGQMLKKRMRGTSRLTRHGFSKPGPEIGALKPMQQRRTRSGFWGIVHGKRKRKKKERRLGREGGNGRNCHLPRNAPLKLPNYHFPAPYPAEETLSRKV